MLEHIKRLGGDSLLYALMNVGTKLIAFFMLPVYAAYLGASQIGVLENIDGFTSMLTFLVIFGTDSALAFFYFDQNDSKRKETYVQTILMFRLLIAVFFLILSLFTGPIISRIVFNTEAYSTVIHISLTVLVIESVITLVLTYFRFEFLTRKVVVLTVLKLAMAALLSYLFLAYFHSSVTMIFYARVIGAVMVILFMLPYLKRFFTIKIELSLLKEILKYAAPLVPASIAFWVISWSNRFFLTQFDSLSQVGIYGVAVKFAMVITLLTSSVQMAWRPYSMSIKDRKDAKTVFSNIYLYVLLLGMTGLLGIATFIPYIIHWMMPENQLQNASKYIAVLSLGTFLNFYYLIISVGLFIVKQTKPISFYFAIASVISLVLNITLIPLLGLWGAVLAVVICYFFACTAIFIKSQKVYYVPVHLFSLLASFGGGILALITIVYIQEYSNLGILYVLFPWLFFLLLAGFIMTKRKRKNAEG